MTITVDEYKRRRDENTIEYLRQEATGSFDIRQYHGFDALKGTVSKWVLASKTYDILSAVILGFLPILITKTGTDAMRLVDTNFRPAELKSTYTDESKFIKTENDAIYSATQDKISDGRVDRDSTTSFKSNFNATYNIIDNLGVKNIDTFLLVNDSRTDELVECYIMSGNEMEKYLSDKKIPASGAVQIKLTKFEKLGEPYRDTIIPILGLEKWKASLLPTLPLIKVVTPKRARGPKEASQVVGLLPLPKSHPSSQTPIPYNLEIGQQQSLDFGDTLPTYPSLISL